jgi:hypothetical protein
MRLPSTLKKPRQVLLMSAAFLSAATVVVVLSHGAAQATSVTQTPFVSYSAPSGPEKSALAIAETAVHLARGWGEDGEITVELARGTMTQARALMEGQSLATAQAHEAQLKSGTPSSTFCFGGQNASCTAVEQQHAMEELYAEGQASTYLVLMSGSDFTPPERLPKGAKPAISDKVMLLIDAHTGIPLGMTIGAGMKTLDLSELQDASAFVAPARSTTAHAATTTPRLTHNRGSHPKPKFGSLAGVLKHGREVIVFNGRSVFMRISIKRQHFRTNIHMGSYSLVGKLTSGRQCPARKVTIIRQQETFVHLNC